MGQLEDMAMFVRIVEAGSINNDKCKFLILEQS